MRIPTRMLMSTMTNPWEGLSVGGRDARRVDKAGRWDFFWVLADNSDPSLLLRLSDEMEEHCPLPKIQSLEIFYTNSDTGRVLLVRLKERTYIELFAILCRDIVAASEQVDEPQGALRHAIGRTLRWHHLLRGGRVEGLSVEEQRGLVGELDFLRVLIDAQGARAAIEAWKGPEGAAKDFEIAGLCVEVKAHRNAARPYVQISSEDQLSNVEGADIVLRVCDVSVAVEPEGFTLTDHVLAVDAVLREDLSAYAIWEDALAATGFDRAHDYSERSWTVGKVRHYKVEPGFPRIETPLAEGVGRVRYAIAINSCEQFMLPNKEFLDRLEI